MATDKTHITDEMLAAYLDGNTNADETRMVLEAIGKSPELHEVLNIAMQISDEEQYSYDVLPMMKMAAESGDNVCSVVCEAFVLHRRGLSFDEKQLFETAKSNHWLTPLGTPLHAIGQLLANAGLMVTRQYDATLDDIRQALALDNDILAVVDSDKLYPDQPDPDDAPNHVVVVITLTDTAVTIFDPQRNIPADIPQPTFCRAWQESQNYLIRVLQSVDDYQPQPVKLDSIRLDGDLDELREAIAENAHEVWAAARMKEGWTYGPQRDDTLKKHPDLLPYSSLPDSEKEYDRIIALNTIKLVKKLGFDIIKKQS